jgi:hypothetical protein
MGVARVIRTSREEVNMKITTSAQIVPEASVAKSV